MLLIKRRNSIQSTTRIGELFSDAGVISAELVNDSLPIAKRSKLPLGRVLVMSGHLTEGDVACALSLQKSIRDGKTTKEVARRILKIAHLNRTTVDEALALLRWEDAYTKSLTQLGKLLLAAEIVREATVIEMQARSACCAKPLGRTLVMNGVIDEETLVMALNAQILVRDRKVTRIEAIRILQTAHVRKIGLGEAIEALALGSVLEAASPRTPLGELLKEAGLVEAEAAIDALEISLESQRKLGEVLMEQYQLSEHALEAALQLQDMLAARTISIRRAAEYLSLVESMEVSLESIIFEMERLKQVVAFLRAAGILEEQEVRHVAAAHDDYDEREAQMLLEAGVIDPKMLKIGAMCLSLFRQSVLSQRQAGLTARYCLENDIEPKEALVHLDFNDEHRGKYGEDELLGKSA
ncbi:MAG TPA: hypothetical protein V6D17_11815 [Candidatus Obscuribacterales bacterium]